MPATIASLSELIALGRFSVRIPTPLRTLTRTSSFSVTRCNLVRSPSCGALRVGFAPRSNLSVSWESFRLHGNLPGTLIVELLVRTRTHLIREDPTVRETSNPVFRSLPKTQGGYAQFGTGASGFGA